MNKTRQWVRQQDQFGSYARFNYRGESGYGTCAGGIVSLILTVLVGLMGANQILRWMTSAKYDSSQMTHNLPPTTFISTEYTEENEKNTYHLNFDEFIPVFQIQDFKYGINVQKNDASKYEWHYEQEAYNSTT